MNRILPQLIIILLVLITGSELKANCSNGEVEIKISVTPFYFPTEISWELIRNSDQAVIASKACGTYTQSNVDETVLCVSDSEQFTFKAYDDYGDGWNLGTYEITYVSTGCIIASGIPNNSNWGDFNSTCTGLDLEASVVINPGNLSSGCTDPAATNYNPCAMIEDSTCTYGNSCGGGEATVVIKVDGQIFPEDINWVLLNSSGDTIAVSGCGRIDSSIVRDTVCLQLTENYTFQAYDDFGDGWNGGEYSIYFAQTGCEIASGFPNNFYSGDLIRNCAASDLEETVIINVTSAGQGCTDPAATNYDPCAVVDDGNCIFEPGNDLCVNATLISCGATVEGSTLFAIDTLQPNSECGTQPQAAGVWYKIAGTGQDITVSTCGSSFDTKINVYKAVSCDPSVLQSNCIAGNDDACGIQTTITFATSSSASYYILVNGYRGDVGLFTMYVTCANPCTPTTQNDACSSAEEIILQYNSSCNKIQGDNSCAYFSTTSLNCDKFNPIKDVWYTFYTGESTNLYFDLNVISAANLKYALYEDCSQTPIYCEDANTGGLFEFNNLNVNSYYYLQIWNNGYGDDGTFEFCIYDTGAITVCNDTIPFTEADDILSTSANLMWGSVPNDIAYLLRGRPVGTSSFLYFDIPTATTQITLSQLTADTDYEWQVAKVCDTSSSLTGPYTPMSYFTTAECISPIGLFTNNIASNSARLNWEANEEVDRYKILGRELGKSIVSIYVNNPSQEFLDVVLAPNTTYEWTILSRCGAQIASSQEVDTFTTLISSKTDFMDNPVISSFDPGFNVYPNPASNKFSVFVDIEEKTNFSYEVISIDGRIIKEGEHGFSHNEPLTLLREELESGVYHLRVFNDQVNYIERVVLK